MFDAPSVGLTVSSKAWVMPGSPAVPRNSAYSDHSRAAVVPIEIRVSIVAAPWRRLVSAALWNGHAAHTITGAASVSDAHCQYVNCSAGIMASRITGTDSTMLAMSLVRRLSSSGSTAYPSVSLTALVTGSVAEYPVLSTSAISACGSYPAGTSTRALSVA